MSGGERIESEIGRGVFGPDGEAGDALARALLAAPVRDPLRSVPGRATFLWPAEVPWAVLKRTAGDLRRDVWYERLRGRPARAPGQREYDNLVGLAAAGLPVPRAFAWAGSGDASVVAMERVEHHEHLRERLARIPGEWRRWLAPLVELTLTLHRAGWYHRDLYLQHLLLPRGGGLCLIDVGRARRESSPRRRWFVKDLGALLHSTPAEVPPRARLRFLAGYLDGLGVVGRAERRRWARDVERRRTRLAAHVPRHGEAG